MRYYYQFLDIKTPILAKLVTVLGSTMGHVFPEILAKADAIKKTLTREEESFLRTLARGIELFENFVAASAHYSRLLEGIDARTLALRNSFESLLHEDSPATRTKVSEEVDRIANIAMELSQKRFENLPDYFYIARGSATFVQETYSVLSEKHFEPDAFTVEVITQVIEKTIMLDSAADQIRSYSQNRQIPGEVAFALYDRDGFPLDLTELMARERGLTVDVAEFNRLMEEQKARGKAAQKKETISVSTNSEGAEVTAFVGYDKLEVDSQVTSFDALEEGGQQKLFSYRRKHLFMLPKAVRSPIEDRQVSMANRIK